MHKKGSTIRGKVTLVLGENTRQKENQPHHDMHHETANYLCMHLNHYGNMYTHHLQSALVLLFRQQIQLPHVERVPGPWPNLLELPVKGFFSLTGTPSPALPYPATRSLIGPLVYL